MTSPKEAQKVRILDRVPCICYLMQFQKEKDKDILALLNFESKVNAMSLAYMAQLGFKVRKTNVGTQIINGSLLETYGIVIAAFQGLNKFGCSWFFQKTFLLADISIKVVLDMLFLTFSNADV